MTYRCKAFRIGSIQCFAVTDGSLALPARNFFHNAPEDALQAALRRHGIADASVNCPFNCLVLQVEGKTILVDTGFGSGVSPSVGHLVESLADAGVRPEDVDAVILSHGHADHAGGSIAADGAKAFPNATYYLNRDEAEFWLSDKAAAKDPPRSKAARKVIEALCGRFESFGPGDEVLPGITAIAAPGHTPHNLAIRVESGGESLIYVADAVAHPIHLDDPDWHLQPDMDPVGAIAARIALLRRAESEDAWLASYHFPLGNIGKVRLDQVGLSWDWLPLEL